MKIHHLRNATFVIEAGEQFVLVDPMLSEKGMLPPFSYIKYKAQRNPIVALPDHAIEILNKVTLCLITHSQKFGIKALQHTDHLEALNHCPLTRAELLHNLEKNGLKAKTYIPTNGEVITIDMDTLQSSQADAE